MAKLGDKYIAGFFDADGTVGLIFPPGCQRPQIRMAFSQKTSSGRVIELIQKEIGGTVKINTISGDEYSSLTLYGQSAKNALNRIKKHLVLKRHYVNVCLDLANQIVVDVSAAKAYLKEQRKARCLPLPNFPSRRWLAGYFDGDGCLAVGWRGENRAASVLLRVASSDFDTEGLEIIQKAFGGRIHDMRNGRCRQYVLNMPPSKAVQVLEYFAKHLVVKKAQAEFILGCAAMGHFRDGERIKAAMKQLKAHDHRLSEPSVQALLESIRDLPPHKQDYSLFVRGECGRITGKRPQAIVGAA